MKEQPKIPIILLLEELAEYYLKNDSTKERIAKEGQKEVQEKYTYDICMEEILLTFLSAKI